MHSQHSAAVQPLAELEDEGTRWRQLVLVLEPAAVLGLAVVEPEPELELEPEQQSLGTAPSEPELAAESCRL